MPNQSAVLRALNIIGLEDIMRLSEATQESDKPSKEASGEGLVLIEDGSEKVEDKIEEVLRPNTIQPPVNFEHTGEDGDLSLWQHELRKKCQLTPKLVMIEEYRKIRESHLLKLQSSGRDKKEDRFASTNGILVDKKQA